MAEGKKEKKTGLLRLNPKSSNDRGDIIFVHGLRGNPITTWHPQEREDEECWPYWLGQDEPNLGIWSYGYNAPLWRTRAEELFDQGTTLLNALTSNEIGQQQRRAIFITHSLGGLVVKKMLEFATRFENNPRIKAVTEQTKGIVFLATPHLGSDLVNNTLLKIVLRVTGENVNAQELRGHASQLRDLNNWYRQNVCDPIHASSSANARRLKIATQSYYETQPTQIPYLNRKEIIVEPDSAEPGIQDALCTAVNADHINIAKPQRSDDLYKSVQHFIQDSLPTPLALPSSGQTPFQRKQQPEFEKTLNHQQPL
jgi:hypothetical protein